MLAGLRDRIRALTEPTIERLGFDLVAVEWLQDARGPILRLSIDKPGGIAASDCARVSHHVSQVLDEADPIDASYHLEVSSPGIDRPLQRRVDFQRFVGYRAKVRLVEGHARRRFSGRLLGVDGDSVKIEVDGKEYTFPVDAVEKANLVLDLDEYQKLAEGPPSATPESDHDHE
jgi:ribosome maturation factor RimP